jgi:hypothetical protein
VALIERIRSDPDDAEEIRVALERSLEKIPAALRAGADLAALTPDRWERVMASAEAVILHRLSGGSTRP